MGIVREAPPHVTDWACHDAVSLSKPRELLARFSSCSTFARAVTELDNETGAPLPKGLARWFHRHNRYNLYRKNNRYDWHNRKSQPSPGGASSGKQRRS
jgi:hypothetical protein